MKVIKPSFKLETPPIEMQQALTRIERAGRTCYKSEAGISNLSSRDFVRLIMKSGHHSVIEHVSVSVRFITNRGVSHEIVRHRLASYSQESTRYCSYAKDKFGNELTFIRPYWYPETESIEVAKNIGIDIGLVQQAAMWRAHMQTCEDYYLQMIGRGQQAQAARGGLPNDLKTEIVMTCNLREWRHFFLLRTAAAAHPDLRLVSVPLLEAFKYNIPVIFDDIEGVEVK